MSAKHTPGPWFRNIKPASHYPTIFAGRNTHVAHVARVYGADGKVDEAQTEANLLVIRAAPYLLAACKLALLRDDVADCELGDVLRAVIAKAEGEI